MYKNYYQGSFSILNLLYFLDFIFLIFNFRCFVSNKVGYSSVYFNSREYLSL